MRRKREGEGKDRGHTDIEKRVRGEKRGVVEEGRYCDEHMEAHLGTDTLIIG